MHAPQRSFYNGHRAETLADVCAHGHRRGDFDPGPAAYTRDSSILEILTAFEALTIEGEVLT